MVSIVETCRVYKVYYCRKHNIYKTAIIMPDDGCFTAETCRLDVNHNVLSYY